MRFVSILVLLSVVFNAAQAADSECFGDILKKTLSSSKLLPSIDYVSSKPADVRLRDVIEAVETKPLTPDFLADLGWVALNDLDPRIRDFAMSVRRSIFLPRFEKEVSGFSPAVQDLFVRHFEKLSALSVTTSRNGHLKQALSGETYTEAEIGALNSMLDKIWKSGRTQLRPTLESQAQKWEEHQKFSARAIASLKKIKALPDFPYDPRGTWGERYQAILSPIDSKDPDQLQKIAELLQRVALRDPNILVSDAAFARLRELSPATKILEEIEDPLARKYFQTHNRKALFYGVESISAVGRRELEKKALSLELGHGNQNLAKAIRNVLALYKKGNPKSSRGYALATQDLASIAENSQVRLAKIGDQSAINYRIVDPWETRLKAVENIQLGNNDEVLGGLVRVGTFDPNDLVKLAAMKTFLRKVGVDLSPQDFNMWMEEGLKEEHRGHMRYLESYFSELVENSGGNLYDAAERALSIIRKQSDMLK